MSDFNPTTILDTPVVLGTSSGTQEVQSIDFSGQTTGKAATLALDGETTAALKPKAEVTAAEVKTKLEALSNVGPGEDFELVSVTGPTAGPIVVTFVGKDGNVPAIVPAAAEGSAPVVTTTTQGEKPAEAVQRGTGFADRTGEVSQLTGESPSARRAAHGGEFGD